MLPNSLADAIVAWFGDASRLWFVRFISGSIWVGSTSLVFTFFNFGTVPFRFVFGLLDTGGTCASTALYYHARGVFVFAFILIPSSLFLKGGEHARENNAGWLGGGWGGCSVRPISLARAVILDLDGGAYPICAFTVAAHCFPMYADVYNSQY